ncbi:MAG: hypothetical protein A2381_13270 [Bdellovibrionales bacterium RIFOXYB1_FULL_37_110]|nr:MAG: hypothetical protein A2181_02595 [Bdellovibrionales bacterium RIFOXYA1_FULL_38_20]OFZ51673.1 MAG: hypothetical protein A2417_12930 [Bdellovibrionales bacterium RIFOXYC1_FULL_37_79]OFZ60500.1 MAG: hypothetical protein A2381_13270 [Bdellovibrionales bacterium RIFOXYB1_FULL_37_110]OFZ65074.1 MAG: hypothetical protein A2577_09535 [Bdellovibrionales bacterium RIFOXYD1_FULL_36_51]HAB51301.1 hypothetical protein [Ignavibacteriales bacterium]
MTSKKMIVIVFMFFSVTLSYANEGVLRLFEGRYELVNADVSENAPLCGQIVNTVTYQTEEGDYGLQTLTENASIEKYFSNFNKGWKIESDIVFLYRMIYMSKTSLDVKKKMLSSEEKLKYGLILSPIYKTAGVLKWSFKQDKEGKSHLAINVRSYENGEQSHQNCTYLKN